MNITVEQTNKLVDAMSKIADSIERIAIQYEENAKQSQETVQTILNLGTQYLLHAKPTGSQSTYIKLDNGLGRRFTTQEISQAARRVAPSMITSPNRIAKYIKASKLATFDKNAREWTPILQR